MELSIKKVSIDIKKIGTKNYNRTDDSFDIFVLLNANGSEETVVKRYSYTPKGEEITTDLIKLIKSRFAHNNYDSGMLSHSLIMINKFDEVEEKMLTFVKRTNDKIKDFKNFKSSISYFEMNNTMNNLSFNF